MTKTLADALERALSGLKLSWSDLEATVVQVGGEDTKVLNPSETRDLFQKAKTPAHFDTPSYQIDGKTIAFYAYTNDHILFKAVHQSYGEFNTMEEDYIGLIPRNPTGKDDPTEWSSGLSRG